MNERGWLRSAPSIDLTESITLAPAGGYEWMVTKGDLPAGAVIRFPHGDVAVLEPVRCGEHFTVVDGAIQILPGPSL